MIRKVLKLLAIIPLTIFVSGCVPEEVKLLTEMCGKVQLLSPKESNELLVFLDTLPETHIVWRVTGKYLKANDVITYCQGLKINENDRTKNSKAGVRSR